MAYYANGTLAKSDKRSPKLDSILAKLLEYEQASNIAELLDEEELKKIGYDVEREYEIDKKSRSEWEETANRAMDIALQVRKPKNYPFEKAANIKYPLVTVAALQFGARAYPAIIDGNNVVKAQVLGKDDGQPVMGEDGQPVPVTGPDGQPMPGPDGQPQIQWQVPPGAKRAKAERVSRHMSYQLLTEMEEWEEDTDVLLHHLPIVGCAFRKVWRSEELGRNKSEMVTAVDLVVNQKVRNLDEAPRVTHVIALYPQEIEDRKRSGTFLDIELPMPSDTAGDGGDEDAPHIFLEQHRYLDLDDDGYREPYCVTVHKESCEVVRIVANYKLDDIKNDGKRITRIPKRQYFVKYSFIPDPKGGFYDIGFGRLLESLSETIDTAINQMLDAGHLQTAGGGFIGSGIRLRKKEIRVSPGKYEQVETQGSIRDQVYSHEFPGPSPVLFQLLGMMVEAAKDITAVKDILTGDTGDRGVQTATTTLALIEQGLKVFTAIYKRVYRALKHEFKLLFRLNAEYLDEQAYFTFHDEQQKIGRADYDERSYDICPVADPKMVTDMQRNARANVLLQISQLPIGQVLNPSETVKRVLDVAGIEDVDRLIMQQQGPSPQEQLAVADAEAGIELKKAQSTKVEADAAKTMVEAQLMPVEILHRQEQENKAAVREDQRMVFDIAHKDRDADKAARDGAISTDQSQQQIDISAKIAKAKTNNGAEK